MIKMCLNETYYRVNKYLYDSFLIQNGLKQDGYRNYFSASSEDSALTYFTNWKRELVTWTAVDLTTAKFNLLGSKFIWKISDNFLMFPANILM
jgi:hypothetical protein